MNLIFRLTQIFFTALFWILGKIWFRLEIRGEESLKNLKGPLIIVSNHKSYIDPFIILAALPKWWSSPILPIRAMVLDIVFKIPPLNLFLYALGTYPAYRGQGLNISLAKPLEILKDGGVVGIFPEGRIILTEGLEEFKRGVGELTKKSNAPILPVAVRGTENLILRIFPKPLSRVRVSFGKPEVMDISRPSEEITAKIREKIFVLYTSG